MAAALAPSARPESRPATQPANRAPLPPRQVRPFDFVALGDLPYGDDITQGPPYRHLIGLINKTRPAFSVHVGDFKSGLASCDDAQYARQDAHFARFEHPLFYTPGDNDWFDCRRRGNDPLERLDALRQRFFAEPRSRGGRPRPLQRQSDVPAQAVRHAAFVENLRWSHGGVQFATFHTIGPSNGLDSGDARLQAEAEARDAANADWIAEAFVQAERERAAALVLCTQAAPLVRRDGAPRDHLEASPPFRRTIAQTLVPLAQAWRRPVLFIHGDHHSFKTDQPFRDAQDRVITNLTRLEVFGDPRMHAVRVRILPNLPKRPGPHWQFLPIWNPLSPDPRLRGR